MSYRNLATSLLTCGDLLAGLEQNRSELPFLADATDQMTADLAEMRMLESEKAAPSGRAGDGDPSPPRA